MRNIIAFLCLSVCCFAQQTNIAPQFFGADFTSVIHLPGKDGTGKPATLGGIRLWDDGVKWMQVETSRGVFTWMQLDNWINTASADDLDVLYTFGATPAWAVKGNPPPGCLPPGPSSCAPPMDVDTGDNIWKEYVTALVTRYKGKIKFYELWNEPDFRGFFSGTVKQLVTMSKDAGAIIRAIDPNARILSPSYHGPTMATSFHSYVSTGGSGMFDIVNVHMRGRPNSVPENFLVVWGQVEAELKLDKIDYPVWDDEHGILPTDGMTDTDMLASFAARELLLRASVPLQRQYIYQWDSPNPPYGLQGNLSGTAWNTEASWLLHEASSAVRVAGTIYSVHIGKGVAVWDSSKTCASGFCKTSPYVVLNGAKTYTDITGKETPITGKTVPLGVKPLYLE